MVDAEHPGNGRWVGRAMGSGAHLSGTIALGRAITEAIQERAISLASVPGITPRLDYQMNAQVLASALDELSALNSCARPIDPKLPDTSTDSFEGDLDVLLASLQKIGATRVVAVDLTQPDLGVPVAKLIVPGLEG
jgi:ribosomal protein S12 methylthiotransferase accessory factor